MQKNNRRQVRWKSKGTSQVKLSYKMHSMEHNTEYSYAKKQFLKNILQKSSWVFFLFEKQLLKAYRIVTVNTHKQPLTLQTTDSSRSCYILFASYSVSLPKFPLIHFNSSHPYSYCPLLPYFCFKFIFSFLNYFLPTHSNYFASIFFLLSFLLLCWCRFL